MTETQYQMLRKFGQFARNVRFFTSTSATIGDVVMATRTAQINLDALVGLGYIYAHKDQYRITESGRNLLDMQGKQEADYHRVNNRTNGGHYEPPTWRVREGGNDHLAIRSRGMI